MMKTNVINVYICNVTTAYVELMLLKKREDPPKHQGITDEEIQTQYE